jgi:hypothetical protein
MIATITIDCPDLVALIESAANKLTNGDATEVIALAVVRLLKDEVRTGSLFGAHPGSVRVREDVDLTMPAFDPGDVSVFPFE